MKDLISRLTSRKFILAIAAALAAYGVATQDNVITQSELWAIITPLLTFIGVEGGADIVTRKTNIPSVDEDQSAA